MPQQFDNQEPAPGLTPLQSQRMTADEAKSIIALWQQERTEQTGLTDRPAVPDVAEGLGIGIEDVQRLLEEVREQRAEEERALAYEQELAEIRLAEEERKLAEVRRQRAELRRESAEESRGLGALYQVQERPSQGNSLYTKTQPDPRYKIGGLVLGAALFLVIWSQASPHPPQHVSVSGSAATYDAKGKAILLDISCADGTGAYVPCDDATKASETARFQSMHDKEVADSKKKLHDRQTHRRDH